jgi:hypothetical protein
VHEAENISENLTVIRFSLQLHELGIDAIETLDGLGQEITQQLVHRGLTAADHDLRLHALRVLAQGAELPRRPPGDAPMAPQGDRGSLLAKRLISVAQ